MDSFRNFCDVSLSKQLNNLCCFLFSSKNKYHLMLLQGGQSSAVCSLLSPREGTKVMGKCIYGRKKINMRKVSRGKEKMYLWFKGGQNELQY